MHVGLRYGVRGDFVSGGPNNALLKRPVAYQTAPATTAGFRGGVRVFRAQSENKPRSKQQVFSGVDTDTGQRVAKQEEAALGYVHH